MKHRTGYLFKRGDNWYVSWRVNGKLSTKALRDDSGQAIKTKREAEIARDAFMAPFALSTEAEALSAIANKGDSLQRQVDDQTPALKLTHAWSEYLSAPGRPDTGAAYLAKQEYRWDAFVEWLQLNHSQATELRDVTKKIADEYAMTLNHGRLSPNTYNAHVGLLRLVFRVLADKGKVAENPWAHISRKRLEKNQSRRELSHEELKRVIESATGELRLLLAIGVYTGLRLGDCCTLRWCEVDLARGVITRVPNKIARNANAKPVLVPIHPELKKMLAEVAQGEFVLPDTCAAYRKNILLVTKSLQAHFQANGIRTLKEQKERSRSVVEVGFHSLRHSFVSMCRAANVPLSVVESIVGHSNPAMTRHYTHTSELAARSAIALLPSLTGEQAEPAKTPEALIAEARALAESMTAKTWKSKRSALLKLLAA